MEWKSYKLDEKSQTYKKSTEKNYVERFRGVAMPKCFIIIFHFSCFLSSNGANSRKKMESKFLAYMHLYAVCPT